MEFYWFNYSIYLLNKITVADINLIYILNGLITGRLVGVYWFFIPLFCTYLAIPLFALVPEDKRKNIFIYLCSLAFVLNILIPFIISVFNIKIEWSLSLAVSSGFLFYTLIGYLLDKYEIKKSHCLIIYLLAILGLMMQIVGTYELSMGAGEIIKTYKGYVNLPSIFLFSWSFCFYKV